MMRTTGCAQRGSARSKKCKYRIGLLEHEVIVGPIGMFAERAAHFGGHLAVEGRRPDEQIVDLPRILFKVV